MPVSAWSSTASLNTEVGGLSTDGAVQTVNNIDGMFRGMMADIRTGINAGQFRYVGYEGKSTNYTAVVADRDKYLNFSAPATLSLSPAATLGAGWSMSVYAGSPITIDPNGGELINGTSTFAVTQGSLVRIVCSGTDFRGFSSIGASSGVGGTGGTGKFIRLSDGTQICTGIVSVTTSGAGTPNSTASAAQTFAQPFISAPRVTAAVISSSPHRFSCATGVPTTTSLVVYAGDTGGAATAVQIYWEAVGDYY